MRFAVAALAFFLPLGATTLEQLSLDQMIAKSTSIVRGTVAGSRAVQRGTMIYTAYRLSVADQLKGSAVTSLEVLVPGGTIAGTRQSFAGTPMLKAGAEYAVFVWTSSTGANYIIGLSQGLFDIERKADGQLHLRRGGTDTHTVNSSGREVASTPVSLTWNSLKNKVVAQLGRSAEK